MKRAPCQIQLPFINVSKTVLLCMRLWHHLTEMDQLMSHLSFGYGIENHLRNKISSDTRQN